MRTKSTKSVKLLSIIFFFSGLSALVYQVVWQRLLTTYYGVGPISITLIVTVYMVGLGFGALVGGYLAERSRKIIFVYFLIELSIGCFGVASPSILEFLGRSTAGSSLALSLIYAFSFLSLPTLLMGMTLPLLTKIFNRMIDDFLKAVSFLYFVNTLGAAAGTLVASYLIISFFGLRTAVYVAASINFILAVLIFSVSRSASVIRERVYPETESLNDLTAAAGMGRLIFLLVFVTGFLAIAYEIIWFRVIGILAKDSPYAFTSVLAVYLIGIALGSFAMDGYLKRHNAVDMRSLFFTLQFLLGLSVSLTFIGYFYLTKYTDFGFLTQASFDHNLHPDARTLIHAKSAVDFLGGLYRLFDVFFWSASFVLIPTILMGASFPLVSLLSLSQRNKEGKAVGLVYFFTIAGNALGGVLTGLVLLPYFGTEPCLAAFCSVGIALGAFVSRVGRTNLPAPTRFAVGIVLLAGITIAFPGKSALFSTMHSAPGPGFDTYVEEGIDGVVVTFQRDAIVHNYINGSGHGGRPGYSFAYETIEAMSRPPKLEKVLVIGYGTGTTVETILKSDEVGELVLVELNATLLANLRKMPLFDNMLNDPRIRLIIDDGRRYLLRNPEKFDLIAIDPLRSTTSYSNNLYSADFFRLVRDHLKPDGVFLAWRDEHRVIPRTISSIFEYLEMHSYFCLSSNSPLQTRHEMRQKLIDSFPPTARERLLAKQGYLGDRSYVEALTRGYPINRDWEPWTEYYIGLKARESLSPLLEAFRRRLQRAGLWPR